MSIYIWSILLHPIFSLFNHQLGMTSFFQTDNVYTTPHGLFRLPAMHRLLLFTFSGTRLGDLLHFGQLFKAGEKNYFAQIPHVFAIFVKVSKSFLFLVQSILANFYIHLATFYWSHCLCCTQKIRFSKGRGCGTVGTAVVYDARGPQFESSHRQTFMSDIYLYTVNCIEKTKIKKRRPIMAHLKIIYNQLY